MSNFKSYFCSDLSQQATLLHFEAGENLVGVENAAVKLFFLVRGRIKLSTEMVNGRTVLIDFFSPFCFIGDMELLDHNNPVYQVQAIQDCWCLALAF